jgi:hypothetical protein
MLSLLVACATPAFTAAPTPALAPSPTPLLAASLTPPLGADANNPMDSPDYADAVKQVGPPRWVYIRHTRALAVRNARAHVNGAHRYALFANRYSN